jgi:hypothetical protein
MADHAAAIAALGKTPLVSETILKADRDTAIAALGEASLVAEEDFVRSSG